MPTPPPLSHEDFIRARFRAFDPLRAPADPDVYEPLYAGNALLPTDPIAELRATIELTEGGSCQLFSGFRGTGKSTELRRLRRELNPDGQHLVVLHCDLQAFLNLSTPIDVSDLLMAAAGAAGDALAAPQRLGASPAVEGWWERLGSWLARTRIELPELQLSLKPAEVGAAIKLNLKQDPTFKQRLQQQLAGHLGALTDEVHRYFAGCCARVREVYGEDWQLVVLFDSLEQLRGSAANAEVVTDSVVNLFHVHAEKLHLPGVHVVYTVPPWLKIRAPALPSLYHGYQQIPCVKLRDREGRPFRPGIDALVGLVARRMPDWQRLFRDQEQLEGLILDSGGYLRDLLRLVQITLRLARGRALPLSDDVLGLARDEVRNAYLPLSVEDARWLCEVADSHAVSLPGAAQLPALARFFDNLLVLTYRNGDEWVDVHPLIREAARRTAGRAP